MGTTVSVEVMAVNEVMRLGLVRLLRRQGLRVVQGAGVVVADPPSLGEALKKGRPVVALGTGDPRSDLFLLRQGATAVVAPDDLQLLVRAARAASLGLSLLRPEAVALLRAVEGQPPRSQERQLQLARLVVAGCSVAEMAAALGVSRSTVKLELRRLYRDLGASRRSEAASRLAAAGVTPAALSDKRPGSDRHAASPAPRPEPSAGGVGAGVMATATQRRTGRGAARRAPAAPPPPGRMAAQEPVERSPQGGSHG
ncbi:hypothetical protein HRbin24_00140 [bacterium HR24]|nr:hypothetical protein HRbin24_00140 [bacterium HR24]